MCDFLFPKACTIGKITVLAQGVKGFSESWYV